MTFDAIARAKAGMRSVTSLLQEGIDEPESGRRDHPFATGMVALDEALRGGFRRRDLVLLAGGPGAGKTTLALEWARAAAMQGATSYYVCYGHSETDLLERYLMLEQAAVGREVTDDQTGSRPADGPAEIESAGRVHLVASVGSFSGIDAIESLIPDRSSRDTVLFIDYLQRIPTRGVQFASDDDRIGHLAEALKDVALRRNVTVVALAAIEKSAFAKPRVDMQDVRGSSTTLYEADIVLALNTSGTSSKQHRGVAVSVEKNRHDVAGFVRAMARVAIRPDTDLLAHDFVDDLLVVE
jgi:replicative DNA helicase